MHVFYISNFLLLLLFVFGLLFLWRFIYLLEREGKWIVG